MSAVTITQERDARAVSFTPMEMLNAAVERGDSLDKLERLMALNEKWEAAQAKKAFIEAKAAFKKTLPAIIKDKENKQYNSTYASIGNVVTNASAHAAQYGLDTDWSFDQGDRIKVTCTLKHVAGHSESVSLAAPPDASGQKNPLQQIKSTLTYLKLATFEGVTGIATREGNIDDDGNSFAADTIKEAEVDELFGLIAETQANVGQFLIVAKVGMETPPETVDGIKEALGNIKAKDFPRLKGMLLKKRGAK